MSKKQQKNRYKKWFFILLIFNISYFGYDFLETLTFLNHYKRIFNKVFYPPKVPLGNYIYGIDISQYQGIISWGNVNSIDGDYKIDYIIIRATAGKNHRDNFFTSNWRESKKNNFLRGAYHYFRPNENSTLQAQNFIRNVKLQPGDLPPVLDIEKISNVQSTDNLIKGISNWLLLVENHYGVKPIIYSGAHFFNDYLKLNFNNYLLWVANYNKVINPIQNKKWIMWQFSDNGTVDGIMGPVDLDLFKGSLTDLKKYALK